jgi:DNA-binding YbaB/EbfC family protein
MPSDEDEVPADELPEDTEDMALSEDEDAAGAALTGVLGNLLIQLGEATEEVDDIADAASSTIVEGTAAGGSVVVKLTGGLEAVAVHIDPALVDPGDVAMLEDAVLAALRDALAQARIVQEDLAESMEESELDLTALLGNLGNLANLGGLGLPDFGSLGNPEDLIAGLSGALGNLAGGPGGFSGLSDLMGGLGMASSVSLGGDGGAGAEAADAGERADAGEGADAGEESGDDEAATERPE